MSNDNWCNKSDLKVLVIDVMSNETLYECSVEDMESAYQAASEYEEMGLEVKIKAPSITQTLTSTLGLTHDEEEEYQNSVVAEMEDHDGSCCARPGEGISEPSPEQKHEGDPAKLQ